MVRKRTHKALGLFVVLLLIIIAVVTFVEMKVTQQAIAAPRNMLEIKNGLISTRAHSDTPTPLCEQGWQVLPSPNISSHDNTLNGVAALCQRCLGCGVYF